MNEAQISVMEDIEAEVTAEELTVNAVSPRAEVTRTESGVDITITDVDGTHTASLYDGQTGPQGPTGPAGAPGISPSITITDITGGHRVTITDATGAHSFDVMDGEGGSGAVESVNGKTGAVTLTAQDVGAYEKPAGGIPKADLASAVQTSLSKADTAVQTETDPTVPEWAKAATKPVYSWSEIVEKPAIPTVPTNVSAFTNDAGYLTQHQDISGKVNEPATEGTSGQVLTTDGQGGRSWQTVQGGGEESWELIKDFTPSEDVNLININTDESGSAFTLKKCLVLIRMQSTNTTGNNKKMSFGFSASGIGSDIDLTNCKDINVANQQDAWAYCETNGVIKRASWGHPNVNLGSYSTYADYNTGKDATVYKVYSGQITNFAIRINDGSILFDHTKTRLMLYGVRA